MRKQYMIIIGLLAVLVISFMSVSAWAIPQQLNYQGKLTNPDGVPLNGWYDIIFRIYNADSGGDPLWSEGHAVEVKEGVYNVQLGNVAFPEGLFDNEDLYLEQEIFDPDPPHMPETLSPRQRLTSVAFALKAGDANTLNGIHSWEFVYTHYGFMEANSESYVLGIRNNGDGMGVDVETSGNIAVRGLATQTGSGVNYGGYFEAHGDSGRGVTGAVNGSDGRGIYGYATGTNGVGIYGESINSNGIIGKTEDPDSSGVFGWSTHGIGVRGRSDNDYGVVGWTNASSKSGVYGWSDVGAGVTGRCNGNSHGVFGATFSTDANHAGLYGQNNGDGPGVRGQTASSNPWSPAIYGKNDGAGDGIYGWSQNRHGTVGVTYSPDPESAGVWAKNNNTGPGILAEAGSNGYAAILKGNLLVRSASTGATVAELGEGLDYAEGFHVSEKIKIAAGTVLIIDPDNPGKLALSNKPYDTKVAGIVAGAKGLGSGVRLGGCQFDYDVALAGRVYCNVDAMYGGVSPGDLLTTSPNPGYAMVVKDYSKAQGAILGKAMEKLSQGKKRQILVLVTLQ